MHLRDADTTGQVANLRLTVARKQDHFANAVVRRQVSDERNALAPRLVVKAEGRCVSIVNEKQAFEAGSRRGQGGEPPESFVRQSGSPANLNSLPPDDPAETFSRLLADLADRLKTQVRIMRGGEDRAGERVLGVLLHTRRHPKDISAAETGRAENFCDRRLAVSQRPRLVEDERAAFINPLQYRRILDDDAAPGGK